MVKCSLSRTGRVLGKKWTVPLLQQIELHQSEGFNLLAKRLIKVRPKVLAERLRELEQEGLVLKQTVSGSAPVRTAYSLTEKGKEFQQIVLQLKRWSNKYDPSEIDCVSIECVKCPMY